MKVVSGSQVAEKKEGKETAAYAMRSVLIKIVKLSPADLF